MASDVESASAECYATTIDRRRKQATTTTITVSSVVGVDGPNRRLLIRPRPGLAISWPTGLLNNDVVVRSSFGTLRRPDGVTKGNTRSPPPKIAYCRTRSGTP